MAAVVLVAAACGGTGATASPTQAAQVVPVQEADFKITPATLNLTGSRFTFAVNSAGPTPHNFNIRDSGGATLAATKDLHTGDSDAVTVTLPAGTYTYFCAFPGHESLGMHGTLVVTR
jgi:plastocyanin